MNYKFDSEVALLRHVRSLIEVAIDAVEASNNNYGRTYYHVAVEKLDSSALWIKDLIEMRKGKVQ
jgi:uncharacterized protein YdgA (DUF945 family)